MENTENVVVEKKPTIIDDVKDVIVKHPVISTIIGVKAFDYFNKKNKDENNSNVNLPLIVVGVFAFVAFMYKNV